MEENTLIKNFMPGLVFVSIAKYYNVAKNIGGYPPTLAGTRQFL